jgi:ribose-phosphate pyrophosphokinase
MKSHGNDIRIFSGNANLPLANAICEKLHLSLGKAQLRRFSDGETYFQILENVRGMDVFAIQPTCNPVNDSLIELLVMIDAFKRSSARRITAVMPYYGYARQDRKDKPRVPISAKLVADLLGAAGASRLLTMDLHAGQIQGFFNIPVDHLFAAPVMVKYLVKQKIKHLTVVSPDAGGVERARAYAKRLSVDLAIVDKRRVEANVAEVMHVIGHVAGKDVIIVDDMIDTAGTLMETVKALKDKGAKRIWVCATHGVLSGPAIERINQMTDLERVIITDTILRPAGEKCSKIKVLSVASLLGDAIRSIHEETSVSSLFI